MSFAFTELVDRRLSSGGEINLELDKMRIGKSKEVALALLVGASLNACRLLNPSAGESKASSSNEGLVLTGNMTTPPTLEAVAAQGGLFSGYYRVSCMEWGNVDRPDGAVPARYGFSLPLIEAKEFRGNKVNRLHSWWDPEALFLVVQDKDKISLNQWEKSDRSSLDATYFYSAKRDKTNKNELTYVDKGDEITFTAKDPLNLTERVAGVLPFGDQKVKIVLKKTNDGFHMKSEVTLLAATMSLPAVEFVTTYHTCEFRKVNELPTLKR